MTSDHWLEHLRKSIREVNATIIRALQEKLPDAVCDTDEEKSLRSEALVEIQIAEAKLDQLRRRLAATKRREARAKRKALESATLDQ